MKPTSFRDGLHTANAFLWKYRTLVVLVLFLAIVGISGQFLRGSLVGGPIITIGNGSDELTSLRTCSSTGTVFQNLENLDEVRRVYKQYVSAVVAERENVYRNPSQWKCGRGIEPAAPLLQSLANLLPGWHVKLNAGYFQGTITQPVTFEAFSSILGEFQREYECKLSEIQDRAIATVSRNEDLEGGAMFCCVPDAGMPNDMGCKQQFQSTFCLTPMTTSGQCDGQCDVSLTTADLATRAPIIHKDALQERATSRIALERTLQTLRSFDMNYGIARQLICYERASLDLRNEMSLLADAISCMPKIWDAVTSIHDEK